MSVIVNRKLTMRFPSSHKWTRCVTLKSPKIVKNISDCTVFCKKIYYFPLEFLAYFSATVSSFTGIWEWSSVLTDSCDRPPSTTSVRTLLNLCGLAAGRQRERRKTRGSGCRSCENRGKIAVVLIGPISSAFTEKSHGRPPNSPIWWISSSFAVSV